jgi:hypothetical protein
MHRAWGILLAFQKLAHCLEVKLTLRDLAPQLLIRLPGIGPDWTTTTSLAESMAVNSCHISCPNGVIRADETLGTR